MKTILAVLCFLFAGASHAVTFVYVSNADDGDISQYKMEVDGALTGGARFKAESVVMPMSISPDKRFLAAGVRSKPFAVFTYAIDRKTGALKLLGRSPLAESLPYIRHDNTGKFLLGASYPGHLVSVNRIGADGKVGEPMQVIPTALNAHSIVTDRTNKYVFVPHLGTDQVFQFTLDAKTGRLAANTPPVLQLAKGSGPRHIVISADNKFAYLLNELTATVTTLALDAKTGTLKEAGSVLALPADAKLFPGAPRPSPGRNVASDIWASDLHLTPNGKFLYAAERTSSSINALSVDPTSGKVVFLSSTPTEKQPRGFAIDPTGSFMVVSGEKSETLSSYAIGVDGSLRRVGQFPVGKGANWVEIVSFD